jgi:hypothetical protein
MAQKEASTSTLKWLLKKCRYLWKRMRKSLKEKLNQVAFEHEQDVQALFHRQVARQVAPLLF